LISDEIYDQLVYPPAKASTVAKWLEKEPGSIALVNGLSKSFAMTGLRVGYLLSDKEIIQNLSKIQGQSTSNICSIAQYAALAAFEGSWDFLQEKRRIFKNKRDKSLEIISSWPGVVCPKPDGAFYLFPSFEEIFTAEYPDSTSLCTYILEQAEVALVPGIAFGDDRCLRFSYATDEDSLIKALYRVGEAIKNLA
jgi:aspartate aminotransferase